MSSLTTLRNVIESLMDSGEYADVYCVAVLDWKALPESAKQVKSMVLGDTRITEYRHNTIRIINVHPYGFFQIM